MRTNPSHLPQFAADLLPVTLRIAMIISVSFCLPGSVQLLQAQDYPIKNDRILAPEVTHFTRVAAPGIDAHGDLNLSIPLMTIPGRDGLDFP